VKKLSPDMRRVLLELRSGRLCHLVPNPTSSRMMGVYELEALPACGLPAERIARPTIHSLESRGLVLIHPRGVTLKQLAAPIGGDPITMRCPCCNHTIEIALEASDAGPGAIIVLFRKGKT